MLEKPCMNHAFPVMHLYKDCALMKKYLSGGTRKGEQKKRSEPTDGDIKGKDDDFPDPDIYLMRFGGPAAYESRRRQKLTRREVYATELAASAFLKWSESAITFDRSNHPSSVLQLGRCQLVVDPIIGTNRLTKVLMGAAASISCTRRPWMRWASIGGAFGRPGCLSMASCRESRRYRLGKSTCP
jgi:hypothetical protein